MNQKELALKELALRYKARNDFITFLYLKWERYDKKDFLHNWHFAYLAKMLESTIPSLALRQNLELNTRIMLNMPPSYGKTETLARAFIPFALGVDRTRKFMYISYSDELCKRISAEVRALIKSQFWVSVFKKSAEFLQDNSNEFIFKEGGGCFFTTLKSAITGFHAHCILIDDPIKVSEMASKSARDAVNQNFKGSVISRLKDNQSSIVILMQRLGDNDLCGFLTDPRYQEQSFINQWKILKLQALNKEKEVYAIGDFKKIREQNEPLFPARHNLEDLAKVKSEMGEDDFSTQMQQEPQVSESGFFEVEHFSAIPSFELNPSKDYILVDTAESLGANADDRAICVVGVDLHKELARYCVKDCLSGVWDEEAVCARIVEMLLKYRNAQCFIEGTGGGILIHRILQKKILETNQILKARGEALLSNQCLTYPTIKKITKMQKISALKPYLNTGYLRHLSTASGIEKLKAQMRAFNPEKPHRKNDCIDALASAVHLSECIPPPAQSKKLTHPRTQKTCSWRI